MKICAECHEDKYMRDFEWGNDICKHCQTHRKCSNCKEKLHLDNFEKNANDVYYLMCNDCRSRSRQLFQRKSESVKSLPLEEQYVVCEKCGGKYHKLNEGKSRHQKRWTCIKATLTGNIGKKEYCEWLVANEHNKELLKEYRKSIPYAKEYLKSLKDG